MNLDKKWMQIIDRTNPLYEKGVLDFIEFAFNGFEEGKLLCCTSRKCSNILFRSQKTIYEHLIIIGITKDCYMGSSWRSSKIISWRW